MQPVTLVLRLGLGLEGQVLGQVKLLLNAP